MQYQTSDKFETPRQRRRRLLLEKRAEADFSKAHNAAGSYGAALRGYAKQIAHIVEHFAIAGIVPPAAMPKLREALAAYAKGITPWAERTTARMIAEVNRRNLTAWQQHTAGMSAEMRAMIATAPVGEALRTLLAGQVDLITSLPRDAAERVQAATLEALAAGSRYPIPVDIDDPARFATPGGESSSMFALEDVEAALERAHPDATAAWLKSRATLIARTETARTASVLTQARSMMVADPDIKTDEYPDGVPIATHYIWRTAGDYRVRKSHRKLNGTVHSWKGDPPLCDPPHRAHPGQIWNCRCVALPIVE